MKKMTQKTITEEQKAIWFAAVYAKDRETIEKMLEDGFDVNIKDTDGWTALHNICFLCNGDHIKIVKFLIDKGADVNAQNQFLRTPLHCACLLNKSKDVAKLLIENGADITVRDSNAILPLDYFNDNDFKQYEELMEWLSEEYPEKMLEYMAHENSPSKGVGL